MNIIFMKMKPKVGEVGMTIATLIEKLQADISWLGYNATEREIIEHIKCAITLLKEQEAVPVIQREIMHMLFWCCGSCGVAITDGDKFCRMCGKAVKWDGSSSEIPNN